MAGKEVSADIAIAFAFSSMKLPEQYLDTWTFKDLSEFIDLHTAVTNPKSINTGKTYDTPDEVEKF